MTNAAHTTPATPPCMMLADIQVGQKTGTFHLKVLAKTMDETRKGPKLEMNYTDGMHRVRFVVWHPSATKMNRRFQIGRVYRFYNAKIDETPVQYQRAENVMYELSIKAGELNSGYMTLNGTTIATPPSLDLSIRHLGTYIGRRLSLFGILLNVGPLSQSHGEKPQTIQVVTLGDASHGKVDITLWGNQTVHDLKNDDVVEVKGAHVGEFENTLKIRSCVGVVRVADPTQHPIGPGTFHYVSTKGSRSVNPDLPSVELSLLPSLTHDQIVRSMVTPANITSLHVFKACPTCACSLTPFDNEYECAKHGVVQPVDKLIGNLTVCDSLLVFRFFAESLEKIGLQEHAGKMAATMGVPYMSLKLTNLIVHRPCKVVIKKTMSKTMHLVYDLLAVEPSEPEKSATSTPPPTPQKPGLSSTSELTLPLSSFESSESESD